MLKVWEFPTKFKDFGLSSPLLTCHSFSIRFQNMQKALVLYIFRTPSLRPCWTTQGNAKIQKRAPRCMRALRRKKKRTPRCMGAFRLLMGPQSGPPKIAQTIYFKGFGTLLRQHGKTSLKDMERTATGHRKTKRQSAQDATLHKRWCPKYWKT